MSPRLSDFLAQASPEVRFAIKPYIPFGGVTLLYGKTRIGKSPLTWEMARCIAAGEPFLETYPTTKGRVLYLDLDTPPTLVRQRLALLPSIPDNFYIEFPGVRNILQLTTQEEFRRLQAEVQPIAVFINTLRKLYSGDEKDASLPSRIYATLMAIFAPAALVVIHHDKKSSGDPEDVGDPDEAFSGHMAWLNDCQVGLHVIAGTGHYKRGLGSGGLGMIRLCHAKSQVSATEPPRALQLCKDGTNLVDYRVSVAGEVMKLFHELPGTLTKTDRVRIISQQLKCSERSVWTYLSWLPEPVVHTASANAAT